MYWEGWKTRGSRAGEGGFESGMMVPIDDAVTREDVEARGPSFRLIRDSLTGVDRVEDAEMWLEEVVLVRNLDAESSSSLCFPFPFPFPAISSSSESSSSVGFKASIPLQIPLSNSSSNLFSSSSTAPNFFFFSTTIFFPGATTGVPPPIPRRI